MLQWMGGSRRKVTASRKSAQKRQRQYFQQKKRQQQTAGLGDNAEGTNSCRQYLEKPKSLDILSLLNLATVAQECNSDCTHDLSVLDLLGDDSPNERSGRNQVFEAHVAFSVEGLGKIGMETPVHSPPQPCRASSTSCSTIPNAGKGHHLSNNLKCMMNNLEDQLSAMIHDVDVPLASSSMELPFNSQHIRYHSGNNKSTKFSIQCRMPLETHGCQMDTVFGKEEWPCNNVDSKEASNDEDFPYDGMFDIAWNNLCYNMDTSVDLLRNTRHDISSFDFEDSYMPKESDMAEGLGEFNILESPAPYMKNFSSEKDFMALDVERYSKVEGKQVFKPSSWSYFATEDVKDNMSLLSEESSLSSAVSEKAKCSTSSSLKVGERMKRQDSVLFGNTGENYRMKVVHGDELGYTKKNNIKQGKSSKGSEKYTREQNPSGAKTLQSNRFLRIQKDLELQKNCLFEERCTSGDILSELDSFHNGVKSDSALFEWDLCYKDPSSAFPDPKLYPNRHSSFKRPKFDAPVGCVPPNSRYCDKALFTEPDSPPHSYNPPTFSNIRSKSRDPHLSHASRTVGELWDSSKITDSQGVKNFPTLSRQENVEDKLGLQPTVYEKCHQGAEEEVSVGNNDFPSETGRVMDGLSCTDNSHECKEAKEETKMLIETQQTSDSPEHTEETLSATKEVSAKHKKCVDDTKYTVDTHIPFPSQSESEEKEESESERINIDRKGDSGSSYQVMLERYILQLLLVQKVPKEASEHNSGKMV